ncbi:Molybdopterin converting factor, small subunit [Haloechinothrix alba]|uniref:Molybdopterin converting factor, small subunit n=1 Tax=Haloechinothrix alba TaxID=664784 RepID=A0A238XCS8_9PSEU|nr:MoaD/ThiS family protein [Haloechinothrix alba]SNR56470.1 Molybdopterin converting factor, small subunit [Haloechinothrix alba]
MSTPADPDARTVTVRVRFYASARAAAGSEERALEMPAGSTLGDVVARLRAEHSAELDRILTVASLLVDGVAIRDAAYRIDTDAAIDVLPPFAGG